MTLCAAKFTPEVLLSSARRSPGLTNPAGDKALYTVTTYSFEEHKRTSEVRLIDIPSGQSKLLYNDPSYSEPVWLTDEDFLMIKSGDKGTTKLVWANLNDLEGGPEEIESFNSTIANIKVKKLSDNSFAFACSALATADGQLYNPEDGEDLFATGRVYDSLFVRHWDTWITPERNTIWYGRLVRPNYFYVLDDPGIVNALAGSGLSSPVPPFGGAGDFDISASGLVFLAKDPALDPASYTKTDLYHIPLSSFTEAQAPQPRRVRTPDGLEGYTQTPVFSHNGSQVAFTRMRSNQYESDKPRLLVLPDITNLDRVLELHATADGEGAWDARPDSIVWSADDQTLYVTAEKHGRNVLWAVSVSPRAIAAADDAAAGRSGTNVVSLPRTLKMPEGSVAHFSLLGDGRDGRLFVSLTSLVDSSAYAIVGPSPSGAVELVSSQTKNGRTLGLSRAQVDEIWFPGAGGAYQVHALVVKPSDFDANSKYPLAYLIHGGPQGAWTDSWSTRWNPAIFAEQGYVVVCPNPTGSTGYGMALQNGITGEWGGRPYEDLVRGFEYIEKNMSYVDTDRAVALGASYGGYMINWIQGHPLGRKFKALVCHDGVYSTLNQWTSDELFFPTHDFQGRLWENRATYEKWDPARHSAAFATPELVIHSELDYRLPITEGLAQFNMLQSLGVGSRLLVFPDENHWVLKPENSLQWHREVFRWINKYSGIADDDELVQMTTTLRIE